MGIPEKLKVSVVKYNARSRVSDSYIPGTERNVILCLAWPAWLWRYRYVTLVRQGVLSSWSVVSGVVVSVRLPAACEIRQKIKSTEQYQPARQHCLKELRLEVG